MQNDYRGSYYSGRGLLFLLAMFYLLQMVIGYATYFFCGKWYGLEIQQVITLIQEPDGTAMAINISRWAAISFMLGAFLIPVYLFGKINGSGWVFDGGLDQRLSIKKLGIFLAVLFLGWSVMGLFYELSKNISFPASLIQVANQAEAQREISISTLLDMQEFHELWVGLFIAALLPAICEELFFRGVMLRIFHGIYPRIGFSVGMQALLFAIAHYSLYEFSSIFLMGAIFGIIARMTRTIWYGVILHFIYNGLQVVFKYLEMHGHTAPKWLEHYTNGGWWSFINLAGIIVLLYLTLFKTHKKTLPYAE